MAVEELRTRFREAMDRQDWPTVLEIGERLHGAGEHGEPKGFYAYLMEIAAGSLGLRARAIRYSRMGLELVEPGTILEAGLLTNGTYTAWLCTQPNRALRLGQIFMAHYSLYPPEGRAQRPRVLYHMGMAHEDRQDWPAAIAQYQTALREADEQGVTDLAQMIQVDLALAVLKQRAPEALERAEEIYRHVNPDLLSGRGRFVYLAGQAELQHAHGRYADSNSSVDQALGNAEVVAEAMNRQKTSLLLLRARNSWAMGNRYDALRYGLLAAVTSEGLGTRAEREQCVSFLTAVCDRAQ